MKNPLQNTLLVFAMTLAAIPHSVAQDDASLAKAKTMVKEFIEIRNTVFVPIQKESDKVSSMWYSKQSGQYDIARTLKEMDETTLEKTRTSIMQARHRLEALEELEKLLVKLGDDQSLKDGFIKAAEENIETIKIERDKALKPFSKQRTENYTKYQDKSKEFAEVLKSCFQESGKHDLTKDVKLKYNSFDPVYGRLSTSFYDDKGQMISMSATLYHSAKPNEKHGLFLGKYPITNKSSYGYTMHVGGSEVRISPRIREWDQKQVEAAASDLIDFERLEKINPGK